MEIKILRKQGKSIRKIAKDTARSATTIMRYIKGAEVGYKNRGLKPTKLEVYKDYIKARLEAAYPEWIPATVILKEIEAKGYTGKLRILQDYMHNLKPKLEPEKIVRFETPPGKQMQADWAHFKHGALKLHAFIAILGYSRYSYVYFTEKMNLEALLSSHEKAFEYFGGVTEEILYDNMKTVVAARDAYGTNLHKFNGQFYDFAKHHGFRPKLCQPYRPQSKGKVERFIRYVRESFFIPLCATAKQNCVSVNLRIKCRNFLIIIHRNIFLMSILESPIRHMSNWTLLSKILKP